MAIRRSIKFLLFTSLSLLVFSMLPLHARHVNQRELAALDKQLDQLRNLQLTDLCLTTEARYTRHTALADRHAPFQEHPVALEHFPSGSIILPLQSARANR